MNEAQETYLKNYSAVDKIDQMLLGWDLSYRSWKWRHALTLKNVLIPGRKGEIKRARVGGGCIAMSRGGR